MQQPYYVTLFSRILIYALAASSLNLILGYGGMVSFGHALYFGLGAYAVGILSYHGIGSGWVHLVVAVCAAPSVALVTGVICLRTRGMAFIMITLAFAQMFFFLGVSLKQYGGDDGLGISRRGDFAPLLDLQSNATLYYVALSLLIAVPLLHLAAGAFALRHGAARREDQRASNARAGISSAAVPPRGLRGLGLHRRRRGVAARQSIQVHDSRLYGLDRVRRADRDGGAGRHGDSGRSAPGCDRAPAVRGVDARAPGFDPALPGRSIGWSCSDP